ncbi:hypothetical protein B0H14DRAFT_3163118 [Mycena olivaceomarginata]|nr:hypothetical protein B0H14DRAFT_3163118 [Mycena olivaceomarginata]
MPISVADSSRDGTDELENRKEPTRAGARRGAPASLVPAGGRASQRLGCDSRRGEGEGADIDVGAGVWKGVGGRGEEGTGEEGEGEGEGLGAGLLLSPQNHQDPTMKGMRRIKMARHGGCSAPRACRSRSLGGSVPGLGSA